MAFHMKGKMITTDKFIVAYFAHKFSFRMYKLMPLQCASGSKSCITAVALERSFSRVGSNISFKVKRFCVHLFTARVVTIMLLLLHSTICGVPTPLMQFGQEHACFLRVVITNPICACCG